MRTERPDNCPGKQIVRPRRWKQPGWRPSEGTCLGFSGDEVCDGCSLRVASVEVTIPPKTMADLFGSNTYRLYPDEVKYVPGYSESGQ